MSYLLNLRTEVTGTSPTSIRARVWPAGSAEPSSWQLETSDGTPELQAAGSVGLSTYASGSTTNAPLVVSFDDLTLVAP